MTLQRNSSIALYVQIADRLAEDIAAGKFQQQHRLPSEHDLMARFGVSRVTIRQAIARLLQQGLVVTKQGKGTFIAEPIVQHELRDLKGFYENLISQGHQLETRLLEFAPTTAAANIETKLNAGGLPVMTLKRLYLVNDKPLALAIMHLTPLASRISWAQASQHPTFILLERFLNRKIRYADLHIRAQRAGKEIGRWLDLKPGVPLLVLERISYANNDEACEHAMFYINPEYYEFSVRVQGPVDIARRIEGRQQPAMDQDEQNVNLVF